MIRAILFLLAGVVGIAAIIGTPVSGQRESKSVDELIAEVQKKDPDSEAFDELARRSLTDDRALAALDRIVREHRDFVYVCWAAKAFGRAKNERAADALLAAAISSRFKYANSRNCAVEALQEIGSPKAAEALGAILREPKIDIRNRAAEALGELGTPEAFAVLDAAREHPIAGPLASDVLRRYDLRNKPTVIELKDGTTVTGEIQGTLVLGGQAEQKKVFSAVFYLMPGKAVVAITRKGVEVGASLKNLNEARYALFASRKPLPSDTDLLLLITGMTTESPDFAKNMTTALSTGLTLMGGRDEIRKQSPLGVKLAGEFRVEGDKKELIPALIVNTATGPRTIRVEDVIDYMQPAKKQTRGPDCLQERITGC